MARELVIFSLQPTDRLCSPSPASGTAGKTQRPPNGCCPVLHNHRVGRQRLDGAPSQPHAGAIGAKDFDAWLHGSLGPKRSSRRLQKPCANGKCRRGLIDQVSVTTIPPSLSRSKLPSDDTMHTFIISRVFFANFA